MPKLSSQTVKILDGRVKLSRRSNSNAWQAAFKIDRHLIRISTRCDDLCSAREIAYNIYLDYSVRHRNDIPIFSRRFIDVAAICVKKMREAILIGQAKPIYKDYIGIIEKYLIPYFGKTHINRISNTDILEFSKWRADKIGRHPMASTINNHNSAISRVFDEAAASGYINRSHIPILTNNGKEGQRRPDFTREEYDKLVSALPLWINSGQRGKSRDMRHLLRDYILILTHTGIRHGTEARNLCWKHINLFQDQFNTFLEMSVNGKTGRRDIICRSGTEIFLKRIQSRCHDISNIPFANLLLQQLDKPVFCLPDGSTTKNLHQPFQVLLQDLGILVCPRTGLNRTLYSLRHTYATFALVGDGLDIHTLAIQMGTSIKMIERHYSHLTPRLKKEVLTGRRHDLASAEYIQKLALDATTLNRTVTDDDDIDGDVPAGFNEGTEADGVQFANSEPAGENLESTEEMAFNLFDDGKLTENGLVAALRVEKDGFELGDVLLRRALKAVDNGRLSEAALMRLTGHQNV